MTSVAFPNGITYNVAPLTFSRATIAMLKTIEEAKQTERVAEMFAAIYEAAFSCIQRGGYTPEETEQALESVPVTAEGVELLRTAIGL